jgi:hypothetical protein
MQNLNCIDKKKSYNESFISSALESFLTGSKSLTPIWTISGESRSSEDKNKSSRRLSRSSRIRIGQTVEKERNTFHECSEKIYDNETCTNTEMESNKQNSLNSASVASTISISCHMLAERERNTEMESISKKKEKPKSFSLPLKVSSLIDNYELHRITPLWKKRERDGNSSLNCSSSRRQSRSCRIIIGQTTEAVRNEKYEKPATKANSEAL